MSGETIFNSYDVGPAACLSLQSVTLDDRELVKVDRDLHAVVGAISATFRADFEGTEIADKLFDPEEWRTRMGAVPLLQAVIFQSIGSFAVNDGDVARRAVEGGLGIPDEHESFAALEAFLAAMYRDVADRMTHGVVARSVFVTIAAALTTVADTPVIRGKIRMSRCLYERTDDGGLFALPVLGEWWLDLEHLREPAGRATLDAWLAKHALDDIERAKNFFHGRYRTH